MLLDKYIYFYQFVIITGYVYLTCIEKNNLIKKNKET